VVEALAPFVHAEHADGARLRAYLTALAPFSGRASTLPLADPSTPSSGELRPTTAARPSPARLPAWRWGAWTALGLGTLGLGVVIATRVPARTRRAPAATAATPAPDPPKAAPQAAAVVDAAPDPTASRTVHLRVLGVRGAAVLVDDVYVGTTPLDVALPRREGERHVVLRRAAHRDSVHTVSASADAALELTVEPVPSTSRARHGATAPPAFLKSPYRR
jgi:hypothetical protein